jgi:hypothetical protein
MSNMNTVITEPKAVSLQTEGAAPEQSASVYGGCGTPILKPNAAYLAATAKMDLSNLPDGSMNAYITDGDVKIDFSTPLEKRGPVPLGWATWSSPPYSESPTPDVLVSCGHSLTMDLSEPVSIFSFELEPNQFGTFPYRADFFYGEDLVDSITRDIAGFEGARLLARAGDLIDRVVVSGEDSFAITQVRLQQTVQGRQKTILIAGALLALAGVIPLIL